MSIEIRYTLHNTGARNRREEQRRVGHRARKWSMCVEVRPRRNHPGAWNEPERRLHPHAGELRWDAVGATIVGAECRENQSASGRDRRARAERGELRECFASSGRHELEAETGKRAGELPRRPS